MLTWVTMPGTCGRIDCWRGGECDVQNVHLFLSSLSKLPKEKGTLVSQPKKSQISFVWAKFFLHLRRIKWIWKKNDNKLLHCFLWNGVLDQYFGLVAPLLNNEPLAMLIGVKIREFQQLVASLTPWVDFINIFTHSFYNCSSQKRKSQSSCKYLLTLLGSAHVKAVHRMLMKLSPAYNTMVCN